jgi:hypothetical protein
VICNHLKLVLGDEKKRNEKKRDDFQASKICLEIIEITNKQIFQIKSCLDGKNVKNALKELGVKFHRCIYDNILSFKYDESGKRRRKKAHLLPFRFTKGFFFRMNSSCVHFGPRHKRIQKFCQGFRKSHCGQALQFAVLAL